VLRGIAADYLCPIASTNGQTGGFLRTDIAPIVKGGRRVLYMGDFDLSGGHIEGNTRKVLSEYGPLEWKRLAITAEQIEVHNFPQMPKKDNRYKPPRDYLAVETEALGQAETVRILTEWLENAAPVDIDHARQVEAKQRVQVREVLYDLVRRLRDDGR